MACEASSYRGQTVDINTSVLYEGLVTDSNSKHMPHYSVGTCSLQDKRSWGTVFTYHLHPLTLCEQGLLRNTWQYPKV